MTGRDQPAGAPAWVSQIGGDVNVNAPPAGGAEWGVACADSGRQTRAGDQQAWGWSSLGCCRLYLFNHM